MKKLLIIPALFLILTTLHAQPDVATVKKTEKNLDKQEADIKKEKKEERRELKKLEGKEVNYGTKQQFANDFSNIKASNWSRTKNFDIATFTQNGDILKAYYDADSKLVGTITIKTFADLPAKAQNYINKKYAGYNKTNVVFFDDNEWNSTDMILYNIQFDDADNYFVEVNNGSKSLVLIVNMGGEVGLFKELK